MSTDKSLILLLFCRNKGSSEALRGALSAYFCTRMKASPGNGRIMHAIKAAHAFLSLALKEEAYVFMDQTGTVCKA